MIRKFLYNEKFSILCVEKIYFNLLCICIYFYVYVYIFFWGGIISF